MALTDIDSFAVAIIAIQAAVLCLGIIVWEWRDRQRLKSIKALQREVSRMIVDWELHKEYLLDAQESELERECEEAHLAGDCELCGRI